jgi:DNA-binding transcriptional MerR regulator
MRIGELAERVGLTTHAIRYYERIGLLSPAPRTRNRYRRYGGDAIEELMFVRKAQHLGLTLADIRAVLEISEGGDPPCEHVRSKR